MDTINEYEAGARTLKPILAHYDTILLIANNPHINLEELSGLPGQKLFVFLNSAFPAKSLQTFKHDCLLFSRMTSKEIFGVKKNRILALDGIGSGCYRAVAVFGSGMKATLPDFVNWSGPSLLLSPNGPWPYPDGEVPSTGFLAVKTLLHCKPDHSALMLVGFTGRSSTRRKLNNAHNWVYEQLYLRLLAEAGRVVLYTSGNKAQSAEEMLRKEFLGMETENFNRILHTYAIEELGYLKAAMHGVIKILRPFTNLFQKFHFG